MMQRITTRRYCDKCDTYRNTTVVERFNTFVVKGGKVNLLEKVAICEKCGKEVYDAELGNETLQKVREKVLEGKVWS